MTHERKINAERAGLTRNAMSDFNVLTFNGKAFPATAPLVVGRGRARRAVRLGNLGPMDHHARSTCTACRSRSRRWTAGLSPSRPEYLETTVLVPVGSTRVIEFVPEEPGDWAVHRHTTHHTMMQMGHGLPNMVGAETRALDRRMSRVMPGYMTMGTMGMGGMGDSGPP